MVEPRSASPRRLGLLLGLGLLVGAGGIFVLALVWQHYAWPPVAEVAGQARTALLAWLTSVPLPVYILAFALLPAFGFPLSLFYLTVGAVMGNLWLGLATAWGCVAVDVAFGYWLAVGLAHPLIERIVRKRGIRIPKISPRTQRRWIVLLRISPMPFGMQSFVLGLGRVPFGPYLFWSVAVQMVVGTGAVVFGESMLSGDVGRALVGLFLILATIMAISWWRRRQPPSSHDLAA